MCECWRCMPFGPTQEERDRQVQAALDAQVAALRSYFASPEGQATVERNLRRIGWRPPGEAVTD